MWLSFPPTGACDRPRTLPDHSRPLLRSSAFNLAPLLRSRLATACLEHRRQLFRRRCTGLHASHGRELAQRRHLGRLAVLLRPACHCQTQEGHSPGLLALARTHSLRMVTRRHVCGLHPLRRRRSAFEKGQFDVARRRSPPPDRRR